MNTLVNTQAYQAQYAYYMAAVPPQVFYGLPLNYIEQRCTYTTNKTATEMTAKDLRDYKRFLLMNASSDYTAMVIKEATIQEIRAIAKVTEGAPWMGYGKAMEWASYVLHCASRHEEAPVEEIAFQWSNALKFIRERLKTLGVANADEAWFHYNQNMLEELKNSFVAISRDYLDYHYRTPSRVVFNGLLTFASHYAKHGEPLGMTVAEYLHKGEQLLQLSAMKTKSALKFVDPDGWTLVLGRETPFVKTLHQRGAYQ
ncbi:hypothetical protein QR680_007792 [Steinernema hermaphroditum]|uniref:Uncharacterized protein n=1 Tax=Steinernema hermaphroditum TaxID=289476 RepID=A0AA39IE93_9BILA|nr:hypothetical protein QR680_007792 [Steinernema hermaphroditum]